MTLLWQTSSNFSHLYLQNSSVVLQYKYLNKNKLLVTTKTQHFLTRRKQREQKIQKFCLKIQSGFLENSHTIFAISQSRRIVQTRHHIWNLVRFQHIMLMQHFGECALSTISSFVEKIILYLKAFIMVIRKEKLRCLHSKIHYFKPPHRCLCQTFLGDR